MTQNIYAVKDNKTGFENLLIQPNDACARRLFTTLANEKGNKINVYPADMELWKLGGWDTNTGLIVAMQPEYMLRGTDVKEVAEGGNNQ